MDVVDLELKIGDFYLSNKEQLQHDFADDKSSSSINELFQPSQVVDYSDSKHGLQPRQHHCYLDPESIVDNVNGHHGNCATKFQP